MTSIRRSLCCTHVALLTVLLGCNALTGADDITIGEGDEGDGAGSGAAGSGTGAGSSTGGAGADGTGGTGSGTGGAVQQDPLVDATGVSIQQIAIYQGVKRPLMENGSPASSGVPIVAQRDALVRVFASTDASYNGAPVTARFTIEGQAPIDVVQPVNGAPQEGSLGSTINFDVPGSMITSGAAYRVELLQDPSVSAGQNPSASFPQGGFTPLGAQASGNALRIVLVPIAYGGDGSNRTPDTSAGQIQNYEEAFYSIYPVPSIDLTVRATVTYNGSVSPGGSGWDNLLSAVADLRADDNVPSDVYYYGIFSPAPSFGQYCNGGCVAGLGFVGGANDSYQRASIGLGFTGSGSIETALHEVGHNHGRSHAPCGGAGGADQGFPYGGGLIGSWGYDLLTGELFNPSQNADLMGYCNPSWVSDYTFTAFFNRIKTVNNASFIYDAAMLDQTWERVLIGVDGPSFLDDITLHHPPTGEVRTLTAQTSAGPVEIEGFFAKFDHLDGGLLFWKKPTAGSVSAIAVEHAGAIVQVSR